MHVSPHRYHTDIYNMHTHADRYVSNPKAIDSLVSMTLPGYNSFSLCLSVSTPLASAAASSFILGIVGIDTVLEGGLENASAGRGTGPAEGFTGGEAGLLMPSS